MNLIAVAHYLDALEWQKEIVKIHAVFGGKNPHPNYLVGGVPCSIDVNEVAAINSERLNLVAGLITQADEFINQVYIPDVLAIASFYKDWAKYGGGLIELYQLWRVPDEGLWRSRGVQDSARRGPGTRSEHGASGQSAGQQEIKEYIAPSWYTLHGRRQGGACIRGRARRT